MKFTSNKSIVSIVGAEKHLWQTVFRNYSKPETPFVKCETTHEHVNQYCKCFKNEFIPRNQSCTKHNNQMPVVPNHWQTIIQQLQTTMQPNQICIHSDASRH